MQTYKSELTLSPTRVQTTEMFKNIHKYCPDISTHEQTSSSKGEGQIDKEQMGFLEGQNDLRCPTPLHKSQQSFYPKQIGSNKVDSEEYKVNLSKDNLLRETEVECVNDAPRKQKYETKVMSDTPTYEALLSPNTKKLLSASYCGWGISTKCEFDKHLEQGFDDKSIVFPPLQSKEYSDGRPQEMEIRKAYLQNKIAEAMLRDANNNVIIEKVIVKEKTQSDEKQNRKYPPIEEAKLYKAKSSKENEKPHSPLTSQNVTKLSMEIVGESRAISKYKDPSLESCQLQLDEVKADDAMNTKKNEERLDPPTPTDVCKSSLHIVGGNGVISKSEDPTMESTHLQLEAKTNSKLSNKKNQEQYIPLAPHNVSNLSQQSVGESEVITKIEEPTVEYTQLQLEEGKKDKKLNTESKKECFNPQAPQNAAKSSQQSVEESGVFRKTEEPAIEYTHLQLEEAKKDTKLNTESNQERFSPPAPQNPEKVSQQSVGGSGLISQSGEPNLCAHLLQNEATPDFKLSFGNNDEQTSSLTSKNIAKQFHQVFEGSEVTLKFEDPTTDSFQVTEDDKATKKPFKTELMFSTPKRVVTKVEARNVLQKTLNKAMKNTFKSEKKIPPKKAIKTESVPRNVQKSEQRKSLKYELMLEDITNEELYRSTSAPGGSLKNKNNINPQTEEGVYSKDGNYEKLGGENYITDTNLEENKKETVLAPSYISETNLYLKRPQLKRLSRPDNESRKLWRDEESSQRVYTSEKRLLLRHRGQTTKEPKRDLTKHYKKTQGHKNHQEKRKGHFKVYKISCTTTQKSTSAEKKGKYLAKKDNLFSYKLNWCYRVPIYRKCQRQDNSSQEETTREKEKSILYSSYLQTTRKDPNSVRWKKKAKSNNF